MRAIIARFLLSHKVKSKNALIPKREQAVAIDVTSKRLTKLTWPSQFLKLVSGPALVCLLLSARTFRDTYVFRVLVPFRVCPHGLPICSKISPILVNDRTDNRTIPRTFVERQEKRNEARAKRVANRGRKIKRQNGEIKREGTEFRSVAGWWKKKELGREDGGCTTSSDALVSVATKTNDDCDKHFRGRPRPFNPTEQSWRKENARFHFP